TQAGRTALGGEPPDRRHHAIRYVAPTDARRAARGAHWNGLPDWITHESAAIKMGPKTIKQNHHGGGTVWTTFTLPGSVGDQTNNRPSEHVRLFGDRKSTRLNSS